MSSDPDHPPPPRTWQARLFTAVLVACFGLGVLVLALLLVSPARAGDTPPLAAVAEHISNLQWVLAAVSAGNLALSISTWAAARHKAGAALLDEIKRDLNGQLQQQADALHRLQGQMDSSVTHDHLAEVYSDIKGIAQQLHILMGQQQQMNENLRLLLAQLVRGAT